MVKSNHEVIYNLSAAETQDTLAEQTSLINAGKKINKYASEDELTDQALINNVLKFMASHIMNLNNLDKISAPFKEDYTINYEKSDERTR